MNRNITATILLVMAVGIYVTFTRAKLAEVKAVRQVNDQYLAAIDNADKLVSVRDAVLKDYNDISDDDRDRLDKMIPDTVDNIRLIIDLSDIAQGHGLALRNVKAVAASVAKAGSGSSAAPAPATAGGRAAATKLASIPTPTLDTVTVSFSVSAPYQQFINLLRDLEANLRIMDVTRLTVSVGQNGMYDFGVELKTYWLRQQ